jgi:hypothetical protein
MKSNSLNHKNTINNILFFILHISESDSRDETSTDTKYSTAEIITVRPSSQSCIPAHG